MEQLTQLTKENFIEILKQKKNKTMKFTELTEENFIEILEANNNITINITDLTVENTEFEDAAIIAQYFPNLEKITIISNSKLKHKNTLYLLPKLKEINIDGAIKKLPENEALRICEFLDSFVLLPEEEECDNCKFDRISFLKIFDTKEDLQNFLIPIFENNPKKHTETLIKYLYTINYTFENNNFDYDYYFEFPLLNKEYTDEEQAEYEEEYKNSEQERSDLQKCYDIINHSYLHFNKQN